MNKLTGFELYGAQPWRRPVLGISNNSPPTETTGKRYIVGTEPTGDFAGHTNHLARHDGTQWLFDIPEPGWRLYDKGQGQHLYFTGSAWAPWPPGGTGTPGTDGREVEIQKGTTHVQWRYVGDVAWIDLVALTELKGADGNPGTPGIDGVTPVKGVDYFDGAKGDKGDAGPSVNDVSYYRKAGITNYEAWFTSPRAGTALAGTALVANRIYAMPFVCPKAITVDQIGVYVSTLSTLTARLGIYSDDGNSYPGNLLLDAGTVSVTSTGAKKIAINQALDAGKLYWLVIVCAATPAIYCIPVAAVINVLGTSNAIGTAQHAGLYASLTYGALPTPFPGSPTMIVAAPIPAIFVRLNT